MLSISVLKKVKNIGKNEMKDKKYIQFESITLGDLLTENFVNNSTDFSNFDQMIDVSGIKTKENSFTDVFISKEWEEFVNSTTEFSGWKEMIEKAVENYILSE